MWYNAMYIFSIPMIPRNHHCNGFRVGTVNTYHTAFHHIHTPGQPYIHVPSRSCASLVYDKIRVLNVAVSSCQTRFGPGTHACLGWRK